MLAKTSSRLWLLAALSLGSLLALGGAGFFGLHYLHGGLRSALETEGGRWRYWSPWSTRRRACTAR